MEKINLPFIYELGLRLNSLAEMRYSDSKRPMVWAEADHVISSMEILLEKFPTLAGCATKRTELSDARFDAMNWLRTKKLSEWEELDLDADKIFEKVIKIAKELEIVMCAELNTVAAYNITQKGIYSTAELIENAEEILPEHVLGKLSRMAIGEIRESGKCLAFDCATACAFHMMRATEEVMHSYYVSVCKPKPVKRLQNWGAYITELGKLNKPEVKEVVAMLQQIKDRHRNLIMHPEIVLNMDEAFTLFEIAQGAIIAMADNIKVRSKKKSK